MTLSREQYLYMAKLAEQAERYEEMVKFMDSLVVSSSGAELSVEERNLLSVAYENVIGTLRAAWRIVSSIEQKEEERKIEDHVMLVKEYRSKIENELSQVFAGILKILSDNLIPSAASSESKVFYLKMKGDYHRYFAEFKVGNERKEAAEDTLLDYKAAQDIALADLPPTHIIRLGLALNFSVFYYEILNSSEKACSMAKQAFEEAIAELDTLGEESYKDSNLIMQLLRDNLTLWTSDIQMGELNIENHARYILSVEKKKDSFESVVMEHLRLNGAYWGLTALDIMGKLNAVDQDEVISWVMQCQDESGGFGGNIGHDPHVLYTLSAIQVLALFEKIDVLDTEKVSNYIAGLQNEDGSFSGDMWGEVDTRFSYIALCSLALLNRLDKINGETAVKYIVSCKNLDGGFGCTPGAESHAGQIFCCVGALAITGALHHVDKDLLGWWLCERQVKSGGLNGRPEKLPDVCYSWWVLSSLIMIDRVHWIDKKKLVQFILDCQDKENGGISDRPDDAVDVFHTYFGVAGLSLLEYPGLKPIDPAYALPVDVVNRIFLLK